MAHRISCAQCHRPAFHCYCDHIVSRENRYPIKLLRSEDENKRAFNTGRIAELSLSDCEAFIVDNKNAVDSFIDSILPQKPVVAFPSSKSTPIKTNALAVGTPIIFIDDTWRKAKRFLFENPRLDALPKVCLPVKTSSSYVLRSAKKHRENSEYKNSPPVCTLESIALCLDILEDREDYFSRMLDCLDWIQEQQTRFKMNP